VRTYRIVGPDEFDAAIEYISIEAPLARALIGKGVDDVVGVPRQTEPGVARVLRLDTSEHLDEYLITQVIYR